MTLDWNEYCKLAIQAVAEGVVLLRNNDNVLPLKKDAPIAVYGRIQTNYYKSGTGSGGLVNVSKVTGILDALLESGFVTVDQKLLQTYKEWESENPFDAGMGWGTEPFSQEEMPLSPEIAMDTARRSPTALVIIGRSAGEDKDSRDEPGAYRLSQTELEMLRTVRKAHPAMVVILNVGGIIDMSWVGEVNPDAILYVWQGGMLGGYGVHDVLTGKTNPSGKLPDTIAKSLVDYPAAENYGGAEQNIYAEDIYVGYRYFETFAPEKVMFPFGFGLSYTQFQLQTTYFSRDKDFLRLSVDVTNIGRHPGKEVVQIYIQAPQGKLGKPARTLVAFKKTNELKPGESQAINFEIPPYTFASYDDCGATGFQSCYVLEEGTYIVHTGTSVRDTHIAGTFSLEKTEAIQRLTQRLAPETAFCRLKPKANPGSSVFSPSWEEVPLSTEPETMRRKTSLPKEIPQTSNKGIKLADVATGTASMEEFIAQLNDEDLTCIVRGEGMGSPKVTPGTAGAFGGISDNLKSFGIPCGCCADGPSGMRLDSGVKAFSLPCGTLLASSFNEELSEKLFSCLGMEMAVNRVDVLLGPGMNIHRHPLNGRNFEYFSEDPFLTGKMAAAQIRGLHSATSTGTLKHFCCNNQEFKRMESNSILSERAIREIYLKGYEIVVKEASADAIMTMYGPVNGTWAASRYDLNTEILRNEWGFKGIVVTDWWAMMNYRGEPPSRTNLAAMVQSQNDIYMVCQDAARNSTGDNLLSSLADGNLTRAELQRCASNICNFLLKTRAFQRLIKTEVPVEVVNRPQEDCSFMPDEVVYYPVADTLEIPLDEEDTSLGSSIVLAFNTERLGAYNLSLTASSDSGELAQLPVTLLSQGMPVGMFTWNGTNGKDVTQSRKVCINTKYIIVRLYFAQNGLKLKSLRLDFIKGRDQIENPENYIHLN